MAALAAAGIKLDSTPKPTGGKSRGMMLLEAAGMHLPQTQTPQPKSGKKRLHNGQLTPSSKQSVAELPDSLSILKEMLEAVQACGNMLRLRGKQATVDALQQPVEAYCGRRFRVEYLRQIKHLHPEAFQWRHIMAPGRAGRLEQQLVVYPCEGEEKGQADMQHRQQLLQAITAYHEQHSDAAAADCLPEVPMADLPPPSQLASTPHKTPYKPDLPATPISSRTSLLMSPPPSRISRPLAAATPSRGTATTWLLGADSPAPAAAPAAAHHPFASPASHRALLPPQPAANPRTKKSLFGTDDSSNDSWATQQSGSYSRPTALPSSSTCALPPAASTPSIPHRCPPPLPSPGTVTRPGAAPSLTFTTPASKRFVPPMAGIGAATPGATPKSRAASPLHGLLSAEVLQLLDEKEAAQAALTPAVVEQQRRQQQLALLPRSFDVVRDLFGPRGSCVRPQRDVIAALKARSTRQGGMSLAEAEQQVALLLSEASEWIQLEGATGATPAQLRVARGCDVYALRSKIVALAVQAGGKAASGSVAATPARQLPAAAADSPVSVKQQQVAAVPQLPASSGAAAAQQPALLSDIALLFSPGKARRSSREETAGAVTRTPSSSRPAAAPAAAPAAPAAETVADAAAQSPPRNNTTAAAATPAAAVGQELSSAIKDISSVFMSPQPGSSSKVGSSSKAAGSRPGAAAAAAGAEHLTPKRPRALKF